MNSDTPVIQEEKRTFSIEEDWLLLMDVVLQDAAGQAKTKVPREGFFPKIKVGLIYPGDEEIRGLLNLEPGLDRSHRVARAGAYRRDTDRLVSHCFFFDSTQALIDWLEARDTGAKLIETYHQLREQVD